MMEETYQHYADIKKQIALLEQQADELNEIIKEDIITNGGTLVEASFGLFYLTSRKTWRYSPKVQEEEIRLKDVKKFEEQEGIAEVVKESTSLTFKPSKE